MTRGVLAVVLAAVLVLSPLGAATVVADEHENETATPDAGGDDAGDEESNETGEEEELKTTSEDPVLELKQSEFAVVHEIDRHDDYAIVTIRTTQPVTVDYPTQSREPIGPNSEREIISTTERIPRGETQIRVPLTGDSVFFTVDGATAQVSGEQEADVTVVDTLSPTPALVVGAIAGVAVAGLVAYRRRTNELEEPVRAHEVWNRK